MCEYDFARENHFHPGKHPFLATMIYHASICSYKLDSWFYRSRPYGLYVHAGSHTQLEVSYFDDLSTFTELDEVKNIFIHPEYDPYNLYNDIALLELYDELTYGSMIQPICLPPTTSGYQPGPREIVIVTGWGSTVNNFEPTQLRQARVPVRNEADCAAVKETTIFSGVYFCAGDLGLDTCQGDSGGPLVGLYDDAWHQFGIASWGISCGLWPGFYTRVSNYEEWIASVITVTYADCNSSTPIILEQSEGSISPPVDNGQLQGCSWLIRAPVGMLLRITFELFELSSGGCVYDYLIIYDGSSEADRMYQDQRLCGAGSVSGFESSSNEVLLEYVTNGHFGLMGFTISWTSVADCMDPGAFRCDNNTCLSSSSQCDDTIECLDQMDEIQCAHAFTPTCGKQTVAPEFPWTPFVRVIGGSIPQGGVWPWQIRLDVNGRFFCGGTIIDTQWVLTAAHCVDSINNPPTNAMIVHPDGNGLGSPRSYNVSAVYGHVQYSSAALGYDIALLRLEDPLIFTALVQPLCLPSSNGTSNGTLVHEPTDEEICVVTGFGQTRGGSHSELRQARVPVYSDAHCGEYYLNYIIHSDSYPAENFHCAGAAGLGSCFGDSGGPLLCYRDSWYLFGITSFGVICGGEGHPGFYTRVSTYIDWINAVKSLHDSAPECDGSVKLLTDTSGSISPPSLEGFYLANLDCHWLIQGDPNTVLEIYINWINVECGYDQLAIYDGSSTAARKYQDEDLCGIRFISGFESNTNEVLIVFTSDSNVQFEAFTIEWRSVSDCNSTSFRCFDGSCIPISYQCDNNTDCGDKRDEIECAHSAPEGSCGKQRVAPEFPWAPRIIGGSAAKTGSFPWQVRLQLGPYLCGGTIISDEWVMTAAHCVFEAQAERPYDITVFVYDSESSFTSYAGVNVYVHPEYDNVYFYIGADIALIRLERKLTFSKYVQPVCIPPHSTLKRGIGIQEPSDEICIITGWGRTSHDAPTSPFLRQALIEIYSDDFCEDHYEENIGPYPAGKLHCGGSLGRATCSGDSGGQISCLRGTTWYQFAITSFGFTCGQVGIPSYYTRVSYYTAWVDAVMEADFEDECDGTLHVKQGSSGQISPPTIQALYLNYQECIWLLQGPKGKLLEISFIGFFLVEHAEECIWDRVIIYDGNSTDARKYQDRDLCGIHTMVGFLSSTNEVLVVFQTDVDTQAPGFTINWVAVEPCQNDEFQCWNGTCVRYDMMCDGNPDCIDGSDEMECGFDASELGSCGRQTTAPNFIWAPRIIGGSYATPGSWPWQAALFPANIPTPFCGGALVSDIFVLTSAYCAVWFLGDEENLRVTIGDNDISDNKTAFYHVKNILLHPDFSTHFFGYEVGLLELKHPVSTGPDMQPICISSLDLGETEDGTISVVTGYGVSAIQDVVPSSILRQVRVPIVSRLCAEYGLDTDLYLCGGSYSGGSVGICWGDEGGPMMIVEDGQWMLYGVAAHAFACGLDNIPSVYVRVSSVVDWISEVLDPDPCNPNPCQHGGTCHKTGRGSFRCKCLILYEGARCQKSC